MNRGSLKGLVRMRRIFATAGRRLSAAISIFSFVAIQAIATHQAKAEVDRIEVLERTVFAGGKSFGNVGPYERLRGRIYVAVEAGAPENQSIVDVRLAPRDAQGRVVFATDFILLKPLDAARGNGRILYGVGEGSGISLLKTFNDAPSSAIPATAVDAGNGFLMEQGYTLLSSGWSWDVLPGDGRLRAELPIALEGGKPIYGRVGGEVVVNKPSLNARHVTPGAVGYEPVSLEDGNDILTVRESAMGPRTAIARNRWHFGYDVSGATIPDSSIITLEGGFKPGLIYALTYTARGPRVAGLGLAGIRDTLLFFRNERADRFGSANPLATATGQLPKAVIAVGNGQAGRLLQTMVYHSLVADSRSRMAFDAALINLAGGGRGGFNTRFGQAGRHFSPDMDLDFPSDSFPFATGAQTDPVSKETASVLDRASALNAVPKLFYVNTSAEYWTRSASLIHTAADGSADLAPDRRARIYTVAGGAHVLASAAADRETLAYCRDPLDYRPLLRSLLLHLDGWVTLKKEPPPSAVPLLADGTLGKLAEYVEKFPKIAGLRTPTRMLEPPRLDFGGRFANEGIADVMPPRASKAYTVLVPMADDDGLDKGGIRLPEITVPLGTYTGWNPQNAATGAAERLARDDGSFVPFERTENDRLADSDPRLSIKERYPTRDAYTKAYAAATLALAEKELILSSDVNPMIERAGAFYDRIMARDPADESCSYLGKP